ncbi:FAD:protein FMN transferase [Sulfurimonas aquatica]|nr:FAD:protein FMN transferase [Sulfurimonas aquatica]
MSTELLIESKVSKKVLFECLELAREFEAKYSAYKIDSLLSKINANSGKTPINATKEELEIFQKALDMAVLSDGAFDPTIGSITQGSYGFGTSEEKIPSQKELNSKKELVNYKNIQLTNESIYLTKKGMRLDLGGIGKGYVADKIIEHLKLKGATKGLVSVGGEVCSFGKKYNIAIKNPFNDSNIALIKSSNSELSISTSGDYERYIDSKEHHHILDSKTQLSNHHYSSLTIVQNGRDTTTLDALATVAFNSKPSELKVLAKKFKVAFFALTPQKDIIIENFINLDIEGFELFSL